MQQIWFYLNKVLNSSCGTCLQACRCAVQPNTCARTAWHNLLPSSSSECLAAVARQQTAPDTSTEGTTSCRNTHLHTSVGKTRTYPAESVYLTGRTEKRWCLRHEVLHEMLQGLMRSLELRFFPSQLSTLQITVAWNKLLYICFITDWSGELIGGSENCVFAIQIQMEWLIYWQPPGEFGWRGECASFSRRWTAHPSMFFFLTASRLAHTLWVVLSVWNRKTWRRASRWWSHMSTRLYSNVCPLLSAD